MSSDRTMATDALATVGNLIDASAGRDAIHLAVEPVIAGVALSAGERIGLKDGKATSNRGVEILGVVDPFLTELVRPGQRFWMVLLPRTITALRHVWDHPSFTPEPAMHEADKKSASEVWMRKWAMEHVSYDYYGDGGNLGEQEAYDFAIRAGHEHHIGPHESARDYIDNEWWAHWEIITGDRGERDSYFSCGC